MGTALSAQAASVLFPYQGGTGTSTAPTIGQIPIGQGNGTYAPTSTSSLFSIGFPFLPTVYVSSSGSDSNTGITSGSPFATCSKAISTLGGRGEIVMASGDYTNFKCDVSTATELKIRGVIDARVRDYLGLHLTSFTNSSGSIWMASSSVAINATSTSIGSYVFEQGTTEGAIAAASSSPVQKSKFYRLDNYRLQPVATLAEVVAGKYFYNSSNQTVYFRRTDSANPNSTGTGIWIPSQTPNQSFVYGGTGTQEIEIDNVEVYYGYENFKFDGLKRVITRNITAFGGGVTGVSSHDVDWVENWYPEFAANNADGHAITGGAGSVTTTGHTRTFDYYPWGHDNGDQAITAHQLTSAKVFGGLIEYNADGGVFGGGNTEVQGTYSQYNRLAGFGITINPGTDERAVTMSCNGCFSNHDQNGYYNTASTTGSSLKVLNSAVYNATQSGIIGNGGTIEYSNIDAFGNASDFAGGPFVRIPGGRIGGFAAPFTVSDDGYGSNHFQAHSTLTDGYFGIDGSAQVRITSTRQIYELAFGDILLAPYPDNAVKISSTGVTNGYQLSVGPDSSTNYMSLLVGATGASAFDAHGAGANFSFADNVGIATTSPGAKLTVQDGDVYVSSSTRGIILTSPDGTCSRGTINNADLLSFASVACP